MIDYDDNDDDDDDKNNNNVICVRLQPIQFDRSTLISPEVLPRQLTAKRNSRTFWQPETLMHNSRLTFKVGIFTIKEHTSIVKLLINHVKAC
jgi:hypothetical protein